MAARGAPSGSPSDRPVVLFVGRIQPLKAPDLAIRALAAMVHHPTALLVIVGGASGADGDRRGRRWPGAWPSSSGVGERVRFVAPQPHHILSSWYRAADLVIVPSRSESFGLVALEAAACGIPVVASAVGGLLNIVHDGVTGHLVDGRDPARYARAMSQLLGDPARRGGDGRRRQRAGASGSRGASPPPACAGCTPTWRRSRRRRWSRARERP